MMKVAGKDIIFAEILRYSDDRLADIMYRIILDIWIAERFTKYWRRAVIIPLYQRYKRDLWALS